MNIAAGLINILDGVSFFEIRKERIAVHAIEHVALFSLGALE
jgi:hypothetical protein